VGCFLVIGCRQTGQGLLHIFLLLPELRNPRSPSRVPDNLADSFGTQLTCGNSYRQLLGCRCSEARNRGCGDEMWREAGRERGDRPASPGSESLWRGIVFEGNSRTPVKTDRGEHPVDGTSLRASAQKCGCLSALEGLFGQRGTCSVFPATSARIFVARDTRGAISLGIARF
jgi:hypothetical protein